MDVINCSFGINLLGFSSRKELFVPLAAVLPSLSGIRKRLVLRRESLLCRSLFDHENQRAVWRWSYPFHDAPDATLPVEAAWKSELQINRTIENVAIAENNVR